jgi:hypothetical protein
MRMLTVLALVFLGSVASRLPIGEAHGQPAPGACSYYRNSYGNEVPRPCGDWHTAHGAPPNGATALCGDGTYSWSQHPYSGGTCSHHGGVTQHLD